MQSERIFTVIDSHTAGHPTRVVTQGIPNLPGQTVRDKRDHFRATHDSLRPLLLHEPRGHAAMVAAVPVASQVADQGLFFISSYIYLDMCGHATIGYVATLAATGSLPASMASEGMSIETPAGVVHVTGEFTGSRLTGVVLRNVPSYLHSADLEQAIPGHEGAVRYDLVFGGTWFAVVDAGQFDLPLRMDHVSAWCALGAALKDAVNGDPANAERPGIGSVLFHTPAEGGGRHLVVLTANKFDRSPCGTGTSARLAQLYARGQLAQGQPYRAESVLGVPFTARIVALSQGPQGEAAVVPDVRGMAHVTAFSTLVLEADDPLPGGFLPT